MILTNSSSAPIIRFTLYLSYHEAVGVHGELSRRQRSNSALVSSYPSHLHSFHSVQGPVKIEGTMATMMAHSVGRLSALLVSWTALWDCSEAVAIHASERASPILSCASSDERMASTLSRIRNAMRLW